MMMSRILFCVFLLCLGAISPVETAFLDKNHDDRAHNRLKTIYGRTADDARRHGQLGNMFDADLVLGSQNTTKYPLYAGQEMRLLVKSTFVNNASFFDDEHGRFANLKSSPFHFDVWRRNQRLFPAWNASGPSNVRVRVISAHASRTSTSGVVISCDGKHGPHDIWAEFWGVSPRVKIWGSTIVFAGYVTFTVPPFPFRFCVKDVTSTNVTVNSTTRGTNPDFGEERGWREFENHNAPRNGDLKQFSSHEPIFTFMAPARNYDGDYTAITIIPHTNGFPRPFGWHFNPYRFSTFDSIKLVPAGFPCTYEKSSSSADRDSSTTAYTGHQTYCGANLANPVSGEWIDPYCPTEGSVTEGVAHVGTEKQNNLSTTMLPADFVRSGNFRNDSFLVGYFRLPASGLYDVCVSTRSYRQAAFNASYVHTFEGRYARDARPVWIKAYDGNSSNCEAIWVSRATAVESCQPRNTTLKILSAPVSTTVKWKVLDSAASSWTEVEFSTADGSNLEFTPATSWDHSFPRNYAHLRGGDQFRMVPISKFNLGRNTMTDLGDLYGGLQIPIVVSEQIGQHKTIQWRNRIQATRTDGADLLQTGEGTFKQYFFGVPGAGTSLNNAYPGCFWGGDDNYGNAHDHLYGDPGDQCCAADANGECSFSDFCKMTNRGLEGPTASANLGGDYRSSTQSWLLDGKGPRAFGNIRVPPLGEFLFCYRRVGGSWRVISPKVAASNNSFIPTFRETPKYSYHLNDTAAGSWGVWRINSDTANMDTKISNFYSQFAVGEGSMFKLVKVEDSCATGRSYHRTLSLKPGLLECMPTVISSHPNCRGSEASSSTLRSTVWHYARVPDYVMAYKFRVCFRNKLEGWHHVADPQFSLSAFMSINTEFHPTEEAKIQFTLDDRREGTIGVLRFTRSSGVNAAPALNAHPIMWSNEGDIARVVLANVSGTEKEANCDMIFGTSSSDSPRVAAQVWNPDSSSTDLMIYCPTETNPWCHPSLTRPRRGMINANYPYTRFNVEGDRPVLGLADGTVAAIVVPSRFTTSGELAHYKVCYKPARGNWLEATDSVTGSKTFTSRTASGVRLIRSARHLIGGSFRFFDVGSSDPNYRIQWSTAVAKLVPFGQTCVVQPVGSKTTDNNVTSIAGTGNISYIPRGHGYIVDGTDEFSIRNSANQPGTSQVVRIFLPLPTSSAPSETIEELRLCFLQRVSASQTTTPNWEDLSGTIPIEVRHIGVTWTLLRQPMFDAMLTIRFLGNDWSFHTRPGADMAKLVDLDDVCTDHGETIPSIVTSVHRGVEWNASAMWGNTDLGPKDALSEPYAEATFVVSSRTLIEGSSYKVCFKSESLPWMETLQTEDANGMIAPQHGSTISPIRSIFVGFQFDGLALGQQSDQMDKLLAGISILNGVTPTCRFDFVTAPTARTDNFAILQVRKEDGVGIRGVQCGESQALISGTISLTAVTGPHYLSFQAPIAPGTYVLCYQTTNDNVWYQISPTLGAPHPNPFQVIATGIGFLFPVGTLPGGSAQIEVRDLNANSTGWPQGGLAATDNIRLTAHGSNLCGVVADPNNALGHKFLTALPTVLDTTSILDRRFSTAAISLAASGIFKICYQRTQSETVTQYGTALTGQAWFQIPNIGSALGGGSDFLILNAPHKLRIASCPPYNMTAPKGRMRTGDQFEVTVEIVDVNNQIVPLNDVVVTLQDGNPWTRSQIKYANARGLCRPDRAPLFGVSTTPITTKTNRGTAFFDVSVLSACPLPVGCNLTFAAPGLSPSEPCRFMTRPLPVQEMRIVYQPPVCRFDETCLFRAAGMYGDDRVAHTASDAVTIHVSGSTGFQTVARVNGNYVPVNVPSAVQLDGGFISVEFTFHPASYGAIANITQISISFTANQKTSNITVLTLIKPVLRAVHIVDLYPVGYGPISLDPLTPSWEPLADGRYFRGSVGNFVNGSSVLAAGPGYHLVAAQFYTAVLRAVGGLPDDPPQYLSGMLSVDPGQVISIDQSKLLVAGNAVLGAHGCIDEINCQNLFTGVTWNRPMQRITFRLKNSLGCRKADGGCSLVFKFDGLDLPSGPTSITSPVRSIAERLDVKCALSISEIQTATSRCPSSFVNRGWYVQIQAVDARGIVDEYFQGEAVVAASPDSPHGYTTISAKLAGTATNLAVVPFIDGVAIVPDLTTVKPCSTCLAEIFATWGAGAATLENAVTEPNTVRLGCELATPVFWCVPDATNGCVTTTGYGTSPPTPASETLLYRDTTICVNAMGIDSNGNATLYDTNWVWYYASVVSLNVIEQFTVTDAIAGTNIRQRYKPMSSGIAKFCFTLSAAAMSAPVRFEIKFHVQSFQKSGYWASGETGDCAVPVLLQPKKLLGGIRLSGATGMTKVGSDVLAVEATSASTSSSVTFEILDHYGIASDSSSLLSSEHLLGLEPVQSPGGTVTVTPSGSSVIRGSLTVTCSICLVLASSALDLTLLFTNFGLDTSISFRLVDTSNGNAPLNRRSFLSPNAEIGIDSTVVLFVIDNRATTTRQLVYYPGTSPLRYWVQATTGTADAVPPALHDSSCTAGACPPKYSSMLTPMCNDGMGDLLAANGILHPIKMYITRVSASGSLNSFSEPTSGTQIDIMTTATISVSVGTQLLGCHSAGSTCTNDNSAAPSQTITAYGVSLAEAVTAFRGISDADLRTTRFVLYGMYTSDEADFDGDEYLVPPGTLPSRMGAFVATPTAAVAVSSLSTGTRVFHWQSFSKPVLFVLRNTAGDADACNPTLVPCHDASIAGCEYNGHLRHVGLSQIDFDYAAQPIYVGIPIPISGDVIDRHGIRVWTAAGTVSASIVKSTGCGSGGSLTVSGTTIVNGRATIWISFSEPCEACTVEVAFSPDATQVTAGFYDTLLKGSVNLVRRTRPIEVRGGSPPATHTVLDSSHTAPTVAQTINTQITILMQSRANIGPLSVASSNSVEVAAYNRIQSTERNWWWDGNGGVLRRSIASDPYPHHGTSTIVSGTVPLTAFFTKTCIRCEIIVAFAVGTGTTARHGEFSLLNSDGSTTFTVTTVASKSQIAGYRPRAVYRGDPIGLSFWQVGSELDTAPSFPIPVAGVVPNSQAYLPAANTAVHTVIDSSNGNGGYVGHDVVYTNPIGMSISRVTFSRACEKCNLNISVAKFLHNFTISARATHFRTEHANHFSHVYVTQVGKPTEIVVKAVDDDGATDVLYGNANCKYVNPFFCKSIGDAAAVSALMVGASGQFGDAYEPMYTGFAAANSSSITASLASTSNGNKIANGVGRLKLFLTETLSSGVPIFSSGLTLSSAVDPSKKRAFSPPLPVVSVLPATKKTTVLNVGPLPTQFHVNSSTLIDVGLLYDSAYIYGGKSDLLKVTCSCMCGIDDVPPVASSGGTTHMLLVQGYRRIKFMFYDLTSLCTIRMVLAGACNHAAGNCQSVIQLPVVSGSPDAWRYLRPTSADNGGEHPSGLRYGAVGRKSFLTIQLQRLDAFNVLKDTEWCADCLMRVYPLATSSPSCAGWKTAPGEESGVAFNNLGQATIEISWGASAASYACDLAVEVRQGRKFIVWDSPIGLVGWHEFTVWVSVPHSIRFGTNVSSSYDGARLKTGVIYPFNVEVVDSGGNVVFGESQDSAVDISIIAVKKNVDGSFSEVHPSTGFMALNVNPEATTSLAVARGNYTWPTAARQSAKPVGGKFRFDVVVTNSSKVATLDGNFFLKFVATGAPLVGITTLYSPEMSAEIHLDRLRIDPKTPILCATLQGRYLRTRDLGTTITVQAVDGLLEEWEEGTPLTNAPNVGQPQNLGAVSWFVDPPVADPFIYNATGQSNHQNLSGGSRSWSLLIWNTKPGLYGLYVSARGFGSSDRVPLAISRPAVSMAFGENFEAPCLKRCSFNFLPSSIDTNLDTAYVEAESTLEYRIRVRLLESTGFLAEGDHISVVMLTLKKDPLANVDVALSPGLATLGPFSVRATNGVAEFLVGFVGSTGVSSAQSGTSNTSLHFSAYLEAWCPQHRPSSLLQPDETTENPCWGMKNLTTALVRVTNLHPPSNWFFDPIVLAQRGFFKFHIPFTNELEAVDLAELMEDIAFLLRGTTSPSNRFRYLSGAAVPLAFVSRSCIVSSWFQDAHDLGASVCTSDIGSNTSTCDSTDGDLNCPPQVLSCNCQYVPKGGEISTRGQRMLSRYLLQTSDNSTRTNSVNLTRTLSYNTSTFLAVEFYVDLDRAPAFASSTIFAIADEYQLIEAEIQHILHQQQFQWKWRIDHESIRRRTWGETLNLATPVPDGSGPLNATDSSGASKFSLSLLCLMLIVFFFF